MAIEYDEGIIKKQDDSDKIQWQELQEDKWGLKAGDEVHPEILEGITKRGEIVREYYELYDVVHSKLKDNDLISKYDQLWEDGLNILDFFEDRGGDNVYSNLIKEIKDIKKQRDKIILQLKKYINEIGDELIAEYFQVQYEKDIELGNVELENIVYRQSIRSRDFSFIDTLSESESSKFLSRLQELNISREEIGRINNIISRHRDSVLKKDMKRERAKALEYLNLKSNYPQLRTAAIFLNNEEVAEAVFGRNLHDLDHGLLKMLHSAAVEFKGLWEKIEKIDSSVRSEIARRLQYYTVDNFIQTEDIWGKINHQRYEKIVFSDLKIIIKTAKIVKDVLSDYDVNFKDLDDDDWQEEIISKLHKMGNNT